MDQSSLATDSNTESHQIIKKPLETAPLKTNSKNVDVEEKLQEYANGRSDTNDNDQPRLSNKESNNLENKLFNLANDQSSDGDIKFILDDEFSDVVQQSLSDVSDRSSNETTVNSSHAPSDVVQSSGNISDIAGAIISGIDSINMANDDESNEVVEDQSDSHPDWVTDDEDDVEDVAEDDADDDGSENGSIYHPQEDYSEPESDIEQSDEDDMGLYDLSDSLREQIRTRKIEDNTITYTYMTRASVSDDVKDDCPICLNTFVDQDPVRLLPCFHLFHTACIDENIKQNSLCPKCRMNIKNTGDYIN